MMVTCAADGSATVSTFFTPDCSGAPEYTGSRNATSTCFPVSSSDQESGFYATLDCSQSLGSAISWQGQVFGDSTGQCATSAPCGANNELCPNVGSGRLALDMRNQDSCPEGQVAQLTNFVIMANSPSTVFRVFADQQPPVLAQVNDSVTCLSFGANNSITDRPFVLAVCDAFQNVCSYRYGGHIECVAPTTVITSPIDVCSNLQCGVGECDERVEGCSCPWPESQSASEPGQMRSHCYPVPVSSSSTGANDGGSSTGPEITGSAASSWSSLQTTLVMMAAAIILGTNARCL